MKEIKLKTIEIVNASVMLDGADYQQLPDDERVKLWKISRKLRPITENYFKEKQSAQKTFKPDEETCENFKKGAEYETAKEKGLVLLPITEEEYQEIKKEYIKHIGLVKKALKDLEEAEVDLEIEPLSETGFDKLIGLNKWSLPKLDTIAFIVE